MWELLKNGWETVSTTVSDIWGGVQSSSIYQGAQSFLGSVQAEANSPLGKFATWGYNEFMSNRKTGADPRNLPKAQRISRPGSSAGQALKGAGATNMGITASAARGVRSAMNASPGSPIAVTIQRLQSRGARGPIMNLSQAGIDIKPRAR